MATQNIIHHPLYPSVLASQSVTIADGHRHYKNLSSQPSTVTSEDIKRKLHEIGDSEIPNQVPTSVDVSVQNDGGSVINQLFSSYLQQTSYPTIVESEIPALSEPQPSNADNVLIGMTAMHTLAKIELQSLYNLCEDYIDRMHYTLHIEKQNAKYNAKQKSQYPLVYTGSNIGGFSSQGNNLQFGQPSDEQGDNMDQNDNLSDGSGLDDDYSLSDMKKPEDVVKELKKRYSGEVLNLAKKKKNFCKTSTDVLNVWFFQHLHDPYPSDDEKRILSQQTGLSLSQVNNWFGNKRMRYKRKMLEQNRKNGKSQDDETQQIQFHNDQDLF